MDECLENFFAELDKEGLLEHSVVLIFGDHEARGVSQEQIQGLVGDDPKNIDVLFRGRIPFIVTIGNSGPALTVSNFGGQIDITPTILHLFGLESQANVLLGQNLLQKEIDGIAYRRSGDFITRNWRFSAGKSSQSGTDPSLQTGNPMAASADLSRWTTEVAKRIRISDLILEGDLASTMHEKLQDLTTRQITSKP